MDQEIFRKSQNINVSKLLMKEGEFRVQQHFVKKKKNSNQNNTFSYFRNN